MSYCSRIELHDVATAGASYLKRNGLGARAQQSIGKSAGGFRELLLARIEGQKAFRFEHDRGGYLQNVE
jgi:hypothetical protein